MKIFRYERAWVLLHMTFAICQATSSSVPSVFERNIDMGNGCRDLQWTVDEELQEIFISWKSSVADAEWIGFGLSENGGMKGADMVTVRTRADGSFAIDDRVSKQKAKPDRDFLQSYELLLAEFDDEGFLHAVVKRPLRTCDSQDIDVKQYDQYVICASGYLQEGDIGYHGPLQSSASVNLVTNKELLYDNNFKEPDDVYAETLSPGVTARSSVNSSLVAFPLDIQARNITLDPDVATHYRCQIAEVPTDFRFVAFEEVWSNQGTEDKPMVGSSDKLPSYLHHISLYRCPDKSSFSTKALSGEDFDCLENMPDCEPVITAARGTERISLPRNVNFPLRKETYLIQVHYENPEAIPIESDFPGLRMWVEPPQAESLTKSGQLLFHDALLSSIQIPADPTEREVTLQYQISGELSKKILPPGGIEILGSLVHMHEQGLRAKVELIRDGVHILNAHETMSYDFNRQAADWKNWRYMPGDSLVVSCTYQSQPDRDVVGGFRSRDEMCFFVAIAVPEIPNYGRPTGIMVREGEPFMPTYNDPLNTLAKHAELELSDFTYQALPKERNFVPLIDHHFEYCRIVLADKVAEPTILPIAMGVLLMVWVLFCFTLSNNKVATWLRIQTDNLREKRNSIIYIGELIYSTIALPIIAITLAEIFSEDQSYDSTDINKYLLARGFTNGQLVIYACELMYRIKPNVSLVVHHVITAFIILFLNVAITKTKSYEMILCFGLVLILFAFTEQPMYIVLLMKNMGYHTAYPKTWPRICYGAAILFCLCRVIIISLLVVLIVRGFDNGNIAWQTPKVSYSSWLDRDDTISNQTVSIIMFFGLAGLLLSNVIVVKALHYMAKSGRKKRADGEESKRTPESSGCDEEPTNNATSFHPAPETIQV